MRFVERLLINVILSRVLRMISRALLLELDIPRGNYFEYDIYFKAKHYREAIGLLFALHSEKLHVNEIAVLVVLLFDDKFGYNTKCVGTQRYTLLRQLVKQCTISMHAHLDPNPTFLDRLRLKPSS